MKKLQHVWKMLIIENSLKVKVINSNVLNKDSMETLKNDSQISPYTENLKIQTHQNFNSNELIIIWYQWFYLINLPTIFVAYSF